MPRGLTAVLNQPGKPLELETLPTPEVEPGGMLIKNTAAAICGSDLHYWRNDSNYKGPDMRRVPGHEFTGVVHSLGKGVTTDSLRRPLKEGDRVAFPFFNPCNRCYWCVRGEHHACPHRQRKSKQFTLNEYPYCDGGYAEYYYLPPGHYVFTGARRAARRGHPAGELRALPGAARHRVLRHEVRRHRGHPGRRAASASTRRPSPPRRAPRRSSRSTSRRRGWTWRRSAAPPT